MRRRSVFEQTLLLAALLTVSLIVTVLYVSTLMTGISGCSHEYCIDVGEFQVALALWGTVHYTGYPLYMLLGSPFVTGLRLLGIPPATGASLYSTVWAVLSVSILVLLIHRISKNVWVAGALGLLFATLEPIWVHGVIAEVYSLGAFLSLVMLYLALDLRERWSDKKGWLLALVGGMGVAHHRLLAVVLLPIGIFLLPTALRAWRGRRPISVIGWLMAAFLGFVAGFLPYLDIPLRIRLGTLWFYNRADTWDGFRQIFWAREVSGSSMRFTVIGGEWILALRMVVQTLILDLSVPGLFLIGGMTLRGLWFRETRPFTLLAASLGILCLVPAAIFIRAGLSLPPLLYTLILIGACLLLGLNLGRLPPRVSRVSVILCLCWAGWLGVKNYPFVVSLTRDPAGANYIATVEQVEAPPGSVIMAPWGGSYFALAYAQRVEGRMTQWEIVDHRANFQELLAEDPSRRGIYTHFSTLYLFGPQWWAERLGTPLRITSAGPEMVFLTAQPLDPPVSPGLLLGDGIVLNGWDVRYIRPDALHVVLYWSAVQRPSRNYSTFVYLTDRDEITRPEDLIAQVDYRAPVYGWYPTPEWMLGEGIREDRVIPFPSQRIPQTLFIGMYWQDENGVFHYLGKVRLKRTGNTWMLTP